MTTLLDRFLLGLCVWREARGETSLGRRLVAWTIMNRCLDARHRWPRTPRDVVLQPMQFSSFNRSDPNVSAYPATVDASWDDCVAAADAALAAVAPRLTSANHYHVIGLNPVWRDDAKIVATEGHHVFYEL